MKYNNGWLLPKGINVEPTPVLVPDNAEGIVELLGCDLFDVISNDIGDSDGKLTTIIGYVDDEGLLKNPQMGDLNHLAMYLFDREHPIVGDVLVVGALSPSGEYDGNNYDLPEWVTTLGDEVTEGAADRYNSALTGMIAIVTALNDNAIDEDTFMESLFDDSDEGNANFITIAKQAMQYAEMLAEVETSTPIIEGFEQLLGETDD
jgi:hypothetical protein